VGTIRYNDFCKAYDGGKFSNSHSLSLMLVTDEYKPSEADAIADVKGVLIRVSGALTWLQFISNSMFDIIEKLNSKAQSYIAKNPGKVADILAENQISAPDNFNIRQSKAKYLIVYSSSLNILCFCEELV
jgi:hypothetical protein